LKGIAVGCSSSKKFDIRNILETLEVKDSCEKEHSNYQWKYFSESSECKDVSKSHAECNATHFSGSYVESQQCTFYTVKKVIQEKKACIVKKNKWSDTRILYLFCRTKEEMLYRYPSGYCLFCITVFGKSNLAPGHLKTCGFTAFYTSKYAKDIL